MNRRTFHKLFGMGVIGSAGVLDSLSGARARASNTAAEAQQPRASHTDLGWFREAKFGMMIHWGLYSVLGGEWKGKQLPVPGPDARHFEMDYNVEMIMEPLRIPLAEYRQIGKQFNPVKFDARQWVGLAKAAGMKYIVITAKHQDGFAMFHSKVSKYNIVDATPFGRDPLKELSDACQQEGIRFCLYYSQRDDFEDPNSYGNYWDFHEKKRNFDKYYEEKALPQVRELLTGYGPVGLIWFDHGLYTMRQAEQMLDLVHSLQPQCLVNSRLILNSVVGKPWPEIMGDYQSLGDHQLPVTGAENYFETPQTMNGCWGYSKFDHNWKSPEQVVHELVNVVSKGGNYLLDVGPTGEGVIPQPAVDALEKVGTWTAANSQSIYGTSLSPFGEISWGRVTIKGEKIYLHVFDRPENGMVSLARLKNQVKRAYPLLDNGRTLDVSRDNDKVSIRLPGTKPVDQDDTVLVLEIIGNPELETPLVVQKDKSFIMLTPGTAVASGKAAKYFNEFGGYHIAEWESPQDSVTWQIDVSQPNRYQIWITYAAQKQRQVGKKYRVSVGPEVIEEGVVDTGAFCFLSGLPCETGYQYRTYNIGIANLSKAGRHQLAIRPADTADGDLMYLKQIELTALL
jgi:alpha-L-fucosidase